MPAAKATVWARKEIQKHLLAWYDAEKRDLPWRHTSDPYAIWVSEVMLQQTQIATVLPYYKKWMHAFPTVHSLAEAEEQEALTLWQGLGYYRRCRMLQAGARHVSQHGMPTTAKSWQEVPGVGRYTAGAIASIAQKERTPVVDGNVERVYSRLTDCHLAGADLNKSAWKWAEAAVDKSRPGDWNQALMELGARICKPRNPDCPNCPIHPYCIAKGKGHQSQLPRKPAAAKTIHLQEVVMIPFNSGCFGVRQIPAGRWWQDMWQFPRDPHPGPSNSNLSVDEFHREEIDYAGLVKYQVTNHKVVMRTFLQRCQLQDEDLSWLSAAELELLPMPAPDRRALKLAQIRLAAPSLLPHGLSPR